MPIHHPSERAPGRRAALIRLCAMGAVGTLLLPAFAWAATPFDLADLMRTLSQVKSGEATFTEKRRVAMLDGVQESSGRLSFEAPDTFVRETLKPRRERVAVVGNKVTMSMGSRSRTVALDSVPEASVIMEAVRGTLTGNQESLERHFSAAVSGQQQRWVLELVPRDPRLREQVSAVRLSGQNALVREVAVTMTDGDRSVMTIEPVGAEARPAGAAN